MARERTKSRNWYHNTEILSSRRGCPLPYQGLAGKTPLAYRLPPPAPRDGQQHHAILIRLIPIAKQGCCDVERPRSGTEKIPNLKAFQCRTLAVQRRNSLERPRSGTEKIPNLKAFQC